MKPTNCPEHIWLTYSDDSDDNEEPAPANEMYWRYETDNPELDVQYIRADLTPMRAEIAAKDARIAELEQSLANERSLRAIANKRLGEAMDKIREMEGDIL